MKRLLKYLKKYRKESILAPLFKLLEALMDLMVPLIVAYVIDEAAYSFKEAVNNAFIMLIVLAILGMAFSFTAQYFASKASVGFASDIRQTLFDHIQKFSYAQLDRIGSDTLIGRMTSDINQIQTGLNLALRLLLRSPFIVFGSMIMAFTIDVSSALIFVVAIPILSIIVFIIMLKSIPMFEKVQKRLDNLLSKTKENLTGVRVIRAFRKEDEEIRQFNEENSLLTALNIKVGRLSVLLNPITYVLINIATVILIKQGALRVDSGFIMQGDLVALYNYMAQIIVELIKLASLTITINRSLACANRVADVLDIEAEMVYGNKDVEKNSEYVIEFNDVSFAYTDQSMEAISNISFKVRRNETVGIIGGTGSGKSTIVNLIPRLYDVSSGSVNVYGKDVKDYSKESLLSKIGLVPQKAVLLAGSIRDNLKLGNENASDEDLYEALKIAQAKEIVDGKENGLDYLVEQGGTNFSGGQRQRLTIARALVKKPEILILDDSSSALDFVTDYKLRRAIRNLDMTIIIVSQRTSSVRNADTILVMDDGKLVGMGTHDELLNNNEVYKEIYDSQISEDKGERK